jgi:hypothetical protein
VRQCFKFRAGAFFSRRSHVSFFVDTPARLLLNKTNVTEQAAFDRLQAAYCGTGIEVRFYRDCCTIMRWQIGANGDGQHFALIAYGKTPERLIECLAKRARSQAGRSHH